MSCFSFCYVEEHHILLEVSSSFAVKSPSVEFILEHGRRHRVSLVMDPFDHLMGFSDLMGIFAVLASDECRDLYSVRLNIPQKRMDTILEDRPADVSAAEVIRDVLLVNDMFGGGIKKAL